MSDRLDLFDTLVRAQIELWNAVAERVRDDCGVPLGRIEILRVLDERGGSARVVDIAEDLVITVGAASKLTDRAEASGHVSRRANPDDRRSSFVELTFPGRILLNQGVAAMEAELADRLASVSAAHQDALLDALIEVREGRRS